MNLSPKGIVRNYATDGSVTEAYHNGATVVGMGNTYGIARKITNETVTMTLYSNKGRELAWLEFDALFDTVRDYDPDGLLPENWPKDFAI